MATIEPNKYIEFVRQTTSPASSEYPKLVERLNELERQGADVSRLMTAAFGMSAEAGEFTEVVKKIFLQGKPYTEENVFHMKRELGDLCWYLAQACIALDITFEQVLEMNYEKLSARYPEGAFNVYRSENRVQGDL
jgi:NTP pyrophosphatase (non-canonical NTP hydrolase)